MQTLTYSNTFKDKDDKEETTTNKVLVNTTTAGHQLVAAWNKSSKEHAKGRFHYAVVEITQATKQETDTLHLY